MLTLHTVMGFEPRPEDATIRRSLGQRSFSFGKQRKIEDAAIPGNFGQRQLSFGKQWEFGNTTTRVNY